ncbi:MAG: zinc ribbon domain-containing protein, partial [Oscillospiraceae bacterium]|nr:zinc ribbon domain-containing protein [Oscillospiraceae bacterium]
GETVRCGYCGKKIRDTAKFCPYCGKENTGNGSEFAGKFDSMDGLLVVKSQEIFTGKKTKKSRKDGKMQFRAAAVSLAAVILCAGIYFAVRFVLPEIRYSNAEKLYAEGNTAEAETAFSKLGNYKSSAEYVRKCRYEIALELMNDGFYPEAADAFTSLDGYESSNMLAAECMLKIADGYAEKGNLASAASMYAAAGRPELARLAAKRRAEALAESEDYFSAADVSGKYGNSEAALEYRYTGAAEAQKHGDLKTAADNYALLGDYKDSAELAEKCAYSFYKSEYEKNGASEATVRGFYFLGDYLDSREIFPKIAYEYGKKCFEEKDFFTAAAMFRNADTYEDSQTMLYETRYALGESLSESDPASARSVFALLSTYLDSSKKKKAAAEKLGSGDSRYESKNWYADESWYADGYMSTEGYCTSVFTKVDVLLVSCTAGTDTISPPVTLVLTFRDSAGTEVSADCENVRNSGSFSGSFSLASAASGTAEIIISRKDSGSV